MLVAHFIVYAGPLTKGTLFLVSNNVDSHYFWMICSFFFDLWYMRELAQRWFKKSFPDSMIHGSNMGPIWGRQDPGGSHVGPMNFAIWVIVNLAGNYFLNESDWSSRRHNGTKKWYFWKIKVIPMNGKISSDFYQNFYHLGSGEN